jgi:uncharacterized protein (TIGR03437 family)
VLYGNGFGATSPAAPNGSEVTAALPLAVKPTIAIGGVSAVVTFAGLVGPGLYQVNVIVPGSLPTGDAAVIATASGQQSQANAFLSIQ